MFALTCLTRSVCIVMRSLCDLNSSGGKDQICYLINQMIYRWLGWKQQLNPANDGSNAGDKQEWKRQLNLVVKNTTTWNDSEPTLLIIKLNCGFQFPVPVLLHGDIRCQWKHFKSKLRNCPPPFDWVVTNWLEFDMTLIHYVVTRERRRLTRLPTAD